MGAQRGQVDRWMERRSVTSMTTEWKITLRCIVRDLLKLLGWFVVIVIGSFIAYVYFTVVFNMMSLGH
jgi:hypothetical protein